MSRLAQNTTYLTIASIGQKAIAFVYFALIARAVGVSVTGAYFLALSITTMMGVIADFGLTPVLVRSVAKSPGRAQAALSETLGVKLVFSVIATLAVIIVSVLLDYSPLTRSLMYGAILVMLLDTLHLTYYGVFRGLHRLGTESLGIFVGQLATLAVGGIALSVSASPIWLIAALFAGSLWNVIFSSFRIRREGLQPFHISLNTARTRKMLKVALPFALAAIFVKVYSSVDAILLERHIGESAVGLYSIAYKLTYAFQFLPMAFVAALYPQFSSVIAQGRREDLSRLFYQSMRYMGTIAFPITLGIFAVADIVVPLIYGPDFAGSTLPLQLLIFALLFIFLDFPLGSLLNADDRQVVKTGIMGGTMVINVTANIVLIPLYGIMGATMAALLGFIWLLGAGLVFVRKTYAYSVKRLLLTLAPSAGAGLVMLGLVLASKDTLGIFSIAVGAIAYPVTLFLFGGVKTAEIARIVRLAKR